MEKIGKTHRVTEESEKMFTFTLILNTSENSKNGITMEQEVDAEEFSKL